MQIKIGDNGCWIWQKNLVKNRKPLLAISGKTSYVQTWNYQIWVGPVYEREMVVNICGNKKCVNPFHTKKVARKAFVTKKSIKVSVNGITYPSKAEAMRVLGWSRERLNNYIEKQALPKIDWRDL